MPSKKGKKAGSSGGKKKQANTPNSNASHAGPSTTAELSSTVVSQQAGEIRVVVPTSTAQDPLLAQASSVYEQSAQLTRTSSESTIDNQPSEQAEPTMSSKGKGRATDPPVTRPLIDPRMVVQTLASRLRALKNRAYLTKSITISCSALGLDPSAVDKFLRDRARRMEKIQQRTLADYPDIPSTREDAESFIERLLAAQAAKSLCGNYADVMYFHDDIFWFKYLWGYQPMWAADEEHETTSDEYGLEEHEWRWKALTSALRGGRENEKPKNVVDKDFEELGVLMQKDNVKAAVDQIFQHPEYAKFREDDSGGLIVHAYDADYCEKCEKQTRGLRKLWKGRLRDSVVSGFPHRFLTEFKGPGIAMMHAAGLDNTFRPQENALAGWRGLFRNLCNQLIAQNPYMKGLKLTRLSNEMLKELNKSHVGIETLEELKRSRVAMETLFSLFHDLILDVAEMGVREEWPAQEVIVVIDGIDWFEDRPDKSALPTFDAHTLVQEYKEVVRENGHKSTIVTAHWNRMTPTEQKVVVDWLNAEAKGEKPDIKMPQVEKSGPSGKSDESWEKAVEFFRDLADECNSSELGKKVRFKYILLHPTSSKLGANPSVLERYITLDKDL